MEEEVSRETNVKSHLKKFSVSPEDIVELAKVFTPLTVRIRGGCISEHRPKEWFCGAYPFYEYS